MKNENQAIAKWSYDNRDSVTVTGAESGPEAWAAADDFLCLFCTDTDCYTLASQYIDAKHLEPNEAGEYVFRVKYYEEKTEES